MKSPQPESGSPPADRLAAIEALDDLIIFVDRELRVTSWNVAATRLLDRDPAQAIGAALLTIVTPSQRLGVTASFNGALAGRAVPRQELTMMRRDGGEVAVSIAIAPIRDANGVVSGLAILGHDIGEQQRLQYQLLHSKRMESTGQLAGGVAHEFNNILTAILALADLAKRNQSADDGIREDIDAIQEQATKGARLVRHLLAFSRRQLLRTESIHPGTIAQELEPLLQRLVSERILLDVDIADDTPSVEADRAQLELALVELVSNASDAMGGRGTVSIEMRRETVDGHASLRPGQYLRLSIRDSGPGIDAASSPNLFEPFFTTKGDGHTGLGLAMVEGVIHQHGGVVTLESEAGQGACATILIPAAAHAAEAPVVRSSRPVVNAEGSETILVVEDETAVRTVICRSLRGRGYDVIEAKNGEDALLVAERHNAPIHLVVTDVVMPEMSGTELFHHLRRWYPRMRILFISGYAKGAIPPEALSEGQGAGFLAKPFTLDQLIAEVRRMIQAPRSGEPAGV